MKRLFLGIMGLFLAAVLLGACASGSNRSGSACDGCLGCAACATGCAACTLGCAACSGACSPYDSYGESAAGERLSEQAPEPDTP